MYHKKEHHHDHEHLDRNVIEQNAVNLEGPDAPKIFEALRDICLKKNLVT